MMHSRPQTYGYLLLALFMLLAGCATKAVVKEQAEPLADRIGRLEAKMKEVDDRVAALEKRPAVTLDELEKVQQDVGDAKARAEEAMGTAQAAGARAEVGANRADAAASRADAAANRADALLSRTESTAKQAEVSAQKGKSSATGKKRTPRKKRR